MKDNDPFDPRNSRIHMDFEKTKKGMFRNFGVWAIFAMIINVGFILGTVAGVCWIVKHFFFQ